MEISVLNENFQLEYVEDQYSSLLWNERYNKAGDFELILPMSDVALHQFQLYRYLEIEKSDLTMIIEKIVTETNAEDGNIMTITGRSYESVLIRRIIWGLRSLSGNFQNGIKALLNENLIKPSDSERKVSNIVFIDSSSEQITELKIDTQYTGDNLYEVVCNLCMERNIGWKLRRNLNNVFEFRLYSGIDRSFSQLFNPYVTFSPEFDNLLNTKYEKDTESTKNIVLIAGEGEGTNRRYTTYGGGSTGLERRELFVDARDISSEVYKEGESEPTILTEEEYNSQLQARGKQKLEEMIVKPAFTAEIVSSISYILGVDYKIGDIVEVSNGFGQDERARITEIIMSDGESGLNIYPTFEIIEA